MNFDYFAKLAAEQACPKEGAVEAHDLASGFVDGCSVWATRAGNEKNNARRCYRERAREVKLRLPGQLQLDPWPPKRLHAAWFALEVPFELLSPWYSKDDRPFHVLDNPVRKDRVFGVPFMAAASWKGMLRWACRMQAGLREHLAQGKRFKDWSDPAWILHLFGKEKKEEKEHFQQGTLAFYPTWFDEIGFEVINPHDRARRAGKQPIYYEVVPGKRPDQEGGEGTLRLLHAPWPGMKGTMQLADWLPNLLRAIEDLLTTYGISAKRTVGWGTAEIKKWRAWRNDPQGVQTIEADSREKLLERLLPKSGGAS